MSEEEAPQEQKAVKENEAPSSASPSTVSKGKSNVSLLIMITCIIAAALALMFSMKAKEQGESALQKIKSMFSCLGLA